MQRQLFSTYRLASRSIAQPRISARFSTGVYLEEIIEPETGFSGQKPVTEFDLSPAMVQNLTKAGITNLFPVQIESLSTMLSGKDLMGRSKTGSGKTLAFGIPIVEQLLQDSASFRDGTPKALVLLPTRELASQVAAEMKRIAPQLRVSNFVGGVSYDRQLQEVRRGIDILVGTPGRIIDLLDSERLQLPSVKTIVLDEADMMLKVGFQEAVERIFQDLPEDRQSILWSATFPRWVTQVSKQFLKNPEWIDLVGSDEQTTPTTVIHKAVNISLRNRPAALSGILQAHQGEGQALVFTQTKKEVDELHRYISDPSCRVLHGDLSQSIRSDTINGFRNGSVKTIICTDIAARGLDIANVDLVVHYRLPQDRESFVHRSGRTGRAGRNGVNIVLFEPEDVKEMKEIEKEFGIGFRHISTPNPETMVEQSLYKITKELDSIRPHVTKHFDVSAEKLLAEHGSKILSKALATLCGFDKNVPQYFSFRTGNPNARTVQFKGASSPREVYNIICQADDSSTLRMSDIHSIGNNTFIVDIPSRVVDRHGLDSFETETISVEGVEELDALHAGISNNAFGLGAQGSYRQNGFNRRGRENYQRQGGYHFREGGYNNREPRSFHRREHYSRQRNDRYSKRNDRGNNYHERSSHRKPRTQRNSTFWDEDDWM